MQLRSVPTRAKLIPALVLLALSTTAEPQGQAGGGSRRPGAPEPFFRLVQEPARNPSLGIDRSDNPTSSYLHSGEFRLQRTDLALRGRDTGFAFTRTYRSGNHATGPMGPGWDANIFARLVLKPNGDAVHFDGSGRRDRYRSLGGGMFRAPRGLYTKLREVAGGYELRGRHGTICSFDTAGRMTQVEDRNGNGHEYQYSAGRLTRITDEFGRDIDLGYTAGGLLETITDFSGRVVRFQYDGNDRLVEARSPLVTGTPNGNDFPNGKREQYRYDDVESDPRLASNLVEVIAPNEVEDGSLTPRIQNEYGKSGSVFDRLTQQAVGGTNATGVPAGGTLRFEYDFGPPPTAPAGTFSRTIVTDRKGHETHYDHDVRGHLLRVTEAPDSGSPFRTDYSYNVHGEIVRSVHPEGNERVFLFDSTNPDRFQQGNLLEALHLPGPRSADQLQTRQTYTYEPLFNQLHTTVQPRGHDPAYVPPNGGANSPGRYTTTYLYDFMEAANEPAWASDWGISVPAPLLDLGDLNGDGLTDQSIGNVVALVRPTVTLLPGSPQALVEGDTSQEIVCLFVYNDFGQIIAEEDARGNIDTFTYYPEEDPDGDGADLIAGRNPTTGGYQHVRTVDAVVGPNRQDPLPALGLTHTFELDPRGNVILFIDPNGNEHRGHYNELDQVLVLEDPKVDGSMSNGYQRFFEYDANDNRVSESVENWNMAGGIPVLDGAHPLFVDTWSYDILDDVITATADATRDAAIPPSSEPESLVTRFTYDANENRVLVESPEAVSGSQPDNTLRFVYDERDLLFSETRGEGTAAEWTRTFAYDGNENLVSWTDCSDDDAERGPESETYDYDGFDRVFRRTDRAGNETVTVYDPDGRQVERTRSGPIDGSGGPAVELEHVFVLYDELGRPIQFDNELFLPTGASTTHPVSLIDGPLTPGDGRVSERFDFDSNSRRTFRTEDDGAVFSTEFDGADRVIGEGQPLFDGPVQNETRFEYDGNDNVVRVTETHVNPEGFEPPAVLDTWRVYDALDRVVRETDALGSTTYNDHDSRGNVVTTYDARGALIPDPLGLYGGDINDRGNPVRHHYDGLSRRWLTTYELHVGGEGDQPLDLSNPAVPNGLIDNLVEYDGASRVVRRHDGNQNTTHYTYDEADRITAITYADGSQTTVLYDCDGRPLQRTDANGTVHTYGYDGLDRLVSHTILPDSSVLLPGLGLPVVAGTTQRLFEYDGLSRMTRSVDNNEPADLNDDWVVISVYDSLSRIVEENQNGRSVGCSYAADVRTELFYPGGGPPLVFGYDACDQPNRLDRPGRLFVDTFYQGTCCPPIVRATFDGLQQQATTVVQQLDAAKNVATTQIFGAGNQPIGNESVQRNRNHEVIVQQLELGPPFQPILVTHDWDLSSLSQIDNSNRTEDAGAGPNQRVLEIDYGAAQERLNVLENGLPFLNNQYDPNYELIAPPFEFDGGVIGGNGLRTKDDQYLYQWDGLDRLIAVYINTPPFNVISTYDYDAEPAVVGGRRVEKDVSNSGALDGTTRFYYDGDHVIEETSAAGQTETPKSQFIYGYRAPDDILAIDTDTNADGNLDSVFFYMTDVNSNVVQLVDEQGNPFEFYTYDMLDVPTIYDAGRNQQPFAQFNPYLFTGRRFEAETSLFYYRARYFDPEQGDFLSRDPLGVWGDLDNLGNPYAYVGNDLWNRRDPSGLDDEDPWEKEANDFEKSLMKGFRAVVSIGGDNPGKFGLNGTHFRDAIGQALGGRFVDEPSQLPAKTGTTAGDIKSTLGAIAGSSIGVIVAHGCGGNSMSTRSGGAASAKDITASKVDLSGVRLLFVTSCRGGGNSTVGPALTGLGAKVVITSTELVQSHLMVDFSKAFVAGLKGGKALDTAFQEAKKTAKEGKTAAEQAEIDGITYNTAKGVDKKKPFQPLPPKK